MKHHALIIAAAFIYNAAAAQIANTGNGYNYSSFTAVKKNITSELQSRTDKKFYDHPEYGVLPYDAPCKDCIELLQKRDETHRYFVKNGSNGKVFYQQSSYGNSSYKEGGVLRTIDPRVRLTEQPGIYKASHQPFPVTINMSGHFTSIYNEGKDLQVNRNVSIYNMHSDGTVTLLGEPDWSHYTAGDDGVEVHNFYPGIDLELKVGRGNIESFYRINKPLNMQDGWLVIRDNLKMPSEYVYDYTYSEKQANGFYEGTLFINNREGIHYFYIGAPAAHDVNVEGSSINLNYQIADNDVYDLYVPVKWMNDPGRSYPLVIDPFTSATSIYPQAQITGSGYGANCFSNGCPYTLEVYVPAATIVYDLIYSFNYRTLGSCWLGQGGWDMTYNTCRSPSLAGQFHSCSVDLPGLCILQNLSCYSEFVSCIPAPQCLGYYMPFTMNFYRCTSPGAGCGFSCINADTDWDITVEGYYITVTAKDTTICQGQSAKLTAFPDSGIASSGYTYKWYDSTGLIGNTNPLTVSPTTTTTYTVTAFDCQAQGLDTLTDSAQVSCTVTIGGPQVKVATQDTSVCNGLSVDLTAIADSGIPPFNYTWYPGSLVGESISVSPTTTTTYTVIATDCGGLNSLDSAQATSTVTVKPYDGYNPGFIIDPDTACRASIVTLTGLGTAAQTSYNWLLPGTDGGIYSNSQLAYTIYDTIGIYNIILEYYNGNCVAPDTQQILVESCVGIKESYILNLFTIYPNPSQGSFIIQSDAIKTDYIDAEIYNVMGERIYSHIIREDDLRKGYKLRLDAASGLYLLVLRVADAVVSKKISVLK